MPNRQQNPNSILVLISGNGSNLQAIIDGCQRGHIPAQVCAVISNIAGAGGLERARRAGIDALELPHRDYPTRQAYDAALSQIIDRYTPSLIALAGFMRILSADFVRRYAGKILNIHPSLLPKYRGLHTHQRALEAGDTEQGATVHFVTATLDGGPPILQGKVPIRPGDDPESLGERVRTTVEHRIYPLAIRWHLQNRLHLTARGAELDGAPLPPTGQIYAPATPPHPKNPPQKEGTRADHGLLSWNRV